MIRVGHPRWVGAAAAFVVAAFVATVGPRVGWMEKMDRGLLAMLSGEDGRIVGEGTAESPRAVERLEPPASLPPLRVLFLDDDPDRYFEHTPPPPADLMVVLARLREAGLESVGFGYPLQWEKPDTLALEAMRGTMDRFDRAVIGYVVKDSTAPVPVPPPFLQASMPYGAVNGDRTKLPVVNGVVGLAPEFGGERSWAGFTRIETEGAEERRAYLLARWSDRVIFSVPLALEIARLGLSPDTDVSVRMGHEIALGAHGPRIPIDFRGRVDLPDEAPSRSAAPATVVISEEFPEGFLAGEGPLFFTDERLLGDKANRLWAQRLPRLDAAVRGAPTLTGRTEIPHWPVAAAVILALVLSVGGAWLAGEDGLRRRMGVVIAFGAAVGLLLVAMLRGGIGAPMPLAMLSVPVVLFVATLLLDAVPTVEVVRAADESAAGKTAQASGRKKRSRRRKR
ncbi:hypothetical protein [Haloferula sp. A504]|uniref:hypothetical protein n=1 Tax=Haloferula sp. A504 TaxID=3373601 RepID=UPI0031C43741|nr:hypothetical protein [Verrucomicrobiaceae bacterium E54]